MRQGRDAGDLEGEVARVAEVVLHAAALEARASGCGEVSAEAEERRASLRWAMRAGSERLQQLAGEQGVGAPPDADAR
jgi:hypothetical protein